jgi:hypothetical protein
MRPGRKFSDFETDKPASLLRDSFATIDNRHYSARGQGPFPEALFGFRNS